MARAAQGGIVLLRDLQRRLYPSLLRTKRELEEHVELWVGSGQFERGWLLPDGGLGRPADAVRYLNGTGSPERWKPQTGHSQRRKGPGDVSA
jgi:hypothetical protein